MVAERQTGPSPTRSARRRYRPVCHRADQVKDENARLRYSREPGNTLPIEIVDQAPMIGIPPLGKGLPALKFRQTISVCSPSALQNQKTGKKHRPIRPLWRIRRLRRTLPPGLLLPAAKGCISNLPLFQNYGACPDRPRSSRSSGQPRCIPHRSSNDPQDCPLQWCNPYSGER